VAKPTSKPKSEVVVPQQADWKNRVFARIIWLISSLLAATLRWRWQDDSGAFESEPKKPVIFCIWHNRLALAVILYRRHVQSRWPHRKLTAIVSASRDGGLLSRTMALFGVHTVRGSSSRRGTQALREAMSVLSDGLDLSVTPDGPRGPCYELQPGVVTLAQLTGCKLIPVSYHLSWKIRLKSWDRFQIPLPFARCEVRLDEAIEIPRNLNADELVKVREDVTQRMMAITKD